MLEQLEEKGCKDLHLWAGENFSGPQERIVEGDVSGLKEIHRRHPFGPLCCVIAENPFPQKETAAVPAWGLPDEAFLRGKAPMTKSEIRAVSMSKLALRPGAVCYDIGSGTGSVAVEMGLTLKHAGGQVYAVEYKPEALQLTRENAERLLGDWSGFHVVEGRAPEALKELPAPHPRIPGRKRGRAPGDCEASHGKESPGADCGKCHYPGDSGPADGVPEPLRLFPLGDGPGLGDRLPSGGRLPDAQGGKSRLHRGDGGRTGRMYRWMIAAPASGSGKTAAVCGLLTLLKKRGCSAGAFKCGPDYIDPMFHKKVLGIPGCNLDSFFLEPEQLRDLFCRETAELEAAVVEGVMGYFDGVGGMSWGSSWDIARILKLPVILVVDGHGASLSVLAQIKGFLDYQPTGEREENRIAGVILNRTSPSMCSVLKPRIEKELGIACLGCIPVLKWLDLKSRHLGLLLPDEIGNLQEQMERLSQVLEESVDVERLLELGRGPPTET